MAILAHKEVSEAIIVRLQEEGVLEVTTEHSVEALDHSEANFRAAEIDFAISELTNIAPKDVLQRLQGDVLPGHIIAAAHSTDSSAIIQRLHNLREAEGVLGRELTELDMKSVQLQPWKGFRELLPPETRTGTCTRIFGTVPFQKTEELQQALTTRLPRTSVEIIGEDAGLCTLSVFVWNRDYQTCEEIATAHGWTTVRPPEGQGAPAKLLEKILVRQNEIITELQQYSRERLAMTQHLPDLVKVRTFVHWLEGRETVRERMTTTNSMMLITGWMPATDVPLIDKSLSSISPAVALLPLQPKEGEEPPVLIRNSLLISPFESVTTLYGLPLATEMDPTAALAPFFTLFFALCITDAGYGLAIAVIMGIFLFIKKLSIRKAPLWWAVFFGGIAAFFVGIPFGGWFGLDPNKLPALLHFLRTPVGDGYWFKLQVWNLGTEEGVQFLQNLALILGLTHLFFGMFLAGWHKWIHGNKASAFWEHFTAHILLLAVLARAFAPTPYVPAATYGLYAAVILIVWGKGYGNPWYLRPVMGLLGVANFAIGLLSNGLSYLRILALGLVTGAIALAVDQVATEMGKLFPLWIGIPVVVLVAVGGHTVSIALNTLGSFIHAGRLQFIEFFSQFFEGGGKPFDPFQRSILF